MALNNINNNSVQGGNSYTFDTVAIKGYIEEIRQVYKVFQKRYSNIDNYLSQVLKVNMWDSDTSNMVANNYKVIQSYYDSIYSDFEKIINYLETILANYELVENLNFF